MIRNALDTGNGRSHSPTVTTLRVASPHQNFSKPDSERLFGRIFIGWILALLAFDLLTLRWFPVPWIDEVLYADPAASLVLTGHWTSTLWFGRGDFSHWGGNVPAYGFLLTPWLWLWGAGECAVRSLNYVLVAFTMVVAWFSVKRLNLIPCPKIRFWALLALSLCYPVSYCVRCGRPDVLGMLIFALGSLFWSNHRHRVALAGLFGCAIIIPFAGLQYAFYMPVLLGCLFWAGGKPALPRLCAIIGGYLLGSVLLCSYFQFIVGWDGLQASMAAVKNMRPHDFETILMGQILPYYATRPHFILLIAAGLLLGISWPHLAKTSRNTFGQALVLLLLSGILIGCGAHFMAPYHWLAVAPAIILFASVVAKSWQNLGSKLKLSLILITVGLATTGRITFIAMGAVLGGDSYTSNIEKWATALVPPGATVYADPQIYYALKPRAARIYIYTIVPALTPEEKKAVSIAFVMTNPGTCNIGWLTNNFAGNWVHLGDSPPRDGKKISPATTHFLGIFHAGYYVGYPLAAYCRDQAKAATNSIPATSQK